MIDIAIGAAQFGQSYGMYNTHGAVEGYNASAIVEGALHHSITFFDTARLYGESEAVLGQALQKIKSTHSPSVITKYYADPENPEALHSDFSASVSRLGSNRIYAILIHNADSLLGENGANIWKTLRDIQNANNVPKIGVSIYTPDDFLSLSQLYDPELVQIPCNLLDQRFLQNDVQNLKKEKNIEFHARSLFLQGLLLQPLEKIPSFLKNKKAVFENFAVFLDHHNMSPMELCLSFAQLAQNTTMIDRWVIGVDTDAHLEEIIKHLENLEYKRPLTRKHLESLATQDLEIIDPRLWRKNSD